MEEDWEEARQGVADEGGEGRGWENNRGRLGEKMGSRRRGEAPMFGFRGIRC